MLQSAGAGLFATGTVANNHGLQSGSGKGGVFWHTQGSGKSISMSLYVGRLLQQPEMNNPTIVVTDRNDLDGQLFGQFSMAKNC